MNKIKEFFKANYKPVINPIIVLLCICIVISAALAGANMITKDRIAELEAKQKQESMEKIFVGAEFKQRNDDSGEYYVAVLNGEYIGYIFTEIGKGYGGAGITVMTGINTDGSIKAVSIIDASDETPGLGQNVTKKDFYGQFSDMNGEITINKKDADAAKNEITPVTGATISSKAVKDAVNTCLKRFEKIKTQQSDASDVTDTSNETEAVVNEE